MTPEQITEAKGLTPGEATDATITGLWTALERYLDKRLPVGADREAVIWGLIHRLNEEVA
jgi:hypothetical protein